jgi:hypothetical protein
VLLTLSGAGAQQQQPSPPPSAPPAPKEAVLLRVQVVISRHQGDKTISRQPYMLTVNADGPTANLRMGLQVPVPSVSNDGKTSVVYRDAGTSIDCSAHTLDGGSRFRLTFSLDDSSVAADDQSSVSKGIPQFRSFRLSNQTAILRDGQTTQLTMATEKGSGETVTVDVTMNVIK